MMAAANTRSQCVCIYVLSLYVLYILYVCIEISIFDIDTLKKDVRGLLPQTQCNMIAKTVSSMIQEQVMSCI